MTDQQKADEFARVTWESIQAACAANPFGFDDAAESVAVLALLSSAGVRWRELIAEWLLNHPNVADQVDSDLKFWMSNKLQDGETYE